MSKGAEAEDDHHGHGGGHGKGHHRKGHAGRDDLAGDDTDSTIDGAAGNDRIHGGKGHEHLLGGRGHDNVWGGSGDDDIAGGAGRDRLFGGTGADTLNGGAGDDMLMGGKGRDTFAFDKAFGRDRIMDFKHGEDVIDLHGAGIATFADLKITYQGHKAIVVTAEGTIVLQHVKAPLTADDFHF